MCVFLIDDFSHLCICFWLYNHCDYFVSRWTGGWSCCGWARRTWSMTFWGLSLRKLEIKLHYIYFSWILCIQWMNHRDYSSNDFNIWIPFFADYIHSFGNFETWSINACWFLFIEIHGKIVYKCIVNVTISRILYKNQHCNIHKGCVKCGTQEFVALYLILWGQCRGSNLGPCAWRQTLSLSWPSSPLRWAYMFQLYLIQVNMATVAVCSASDFPSLCLSTVCR